jgi:hypothetical protein
MWPRSVVRSVAAVLALVALPVLLGVRGAAVGGLAAQLEELRVRLRGATHTTAARSGAARGAPRPQRRSAATLCDVAHHACLLLQRLAGDDPRTGARRRRRWYALRRRATPAAALPLRRRRRRKSMSARDGEGADGRDEGRAGRFFVSWLPGSGRLDSSEEASQRWYSLCGTWRLRARWRRRGAALARRRRHTPAGGKRGTDPNNPNSGWRRHRSNSHPAAPLLPWRACAPLTRQPACWPCWR